MLKLTPQTVANWLMNDNGEGATDKEFLETVNLMEEKIKDKISENYTFTDWFKNVIKEIKENESEIIINK